MTPIIRVENISKQYRLGEVGTGTLAHDLNRWWHQVRGMEDPYLKIGEENDRALKGTSEYVWALQDINFDVNEGEVLGIIGKNGAGKSTLLKLLSRVTAPTTGKITAHGKIASLLEVGTGFHPELTGRENVFLNGAIMGMTKSEIRNKFDEIVDFAGCERYIDTPVKRYSSGMHVRLAFAVAAHLEPDILVVDEVLAVGDAEFQKKAIGKMQDVSNKDGRTVLFVSHNMAAVKSLCTRGIILENGRLIYEGASDDAVYRYLKGDGEHTNFKAFPEPLTDGEHYIIRNISVKAKNKSTTDPISMQDEIDIKIQLKFLNSDKNEYHLNFRFKNDQGNYLFVSSSKKENEIDLPGEREISMQIPNNFFNSGNFYVDLVIVKNKKTPVLVENDIVSFTVINEDEEFGSWMGRTRGDLKPNFNWEIN